MDLEDLGLAGYRGRVTIHLGYSMELKRKRCKSSKLRRSREGIVQNDHRLPPANPNPRGEGASKKGMSTAGCIWIGLGVPPEPEGKASSTQRQSAGSQTWKWSEADSSLMVLESTVSKGNEFWIVGAQNQWVLLEIVSCVTETCQISKLVACNTCSSKILKVYWILVAPRHCIAFSGSEGA